MNNHARLKKAEEDARLGLTATTEGTSPGDTKIGDMTDKGPTNDGQAGFGSNCGTVASGSVTYSPSKSKAFHGSIRIEPSAAKIHLVQVVEEIICLMASDPNASLNVTLEINAEFPVGD